MGKDPVGHLGVADGAVAHRLLGVIYPEDFSRVCGAARQLSRVSLQSPSRPSGTLMSTVR